MAFQDDLRTYLERVATQSADSPRSSFNPDVRVHRQHVLRELERLEAAGKSKQFLKYYHKYWSDNVSEFAADLGAELVNGLCHLQPVKQVTDYINIAISRQLDPSTTSGSLIKDAELDRLSRASLTKVTKDERIVEQYALEIRAVRRTGEQRVLTPLGRIALELPDREVVRWLLIAEAVQSRGSDDPWRLSRKSAVGLHAQPSKIEPLNSDEPSPFPASWKTLERLSGMGVLSYSDIEDERTAQPIAHRYDVFPESLPLLAEIAFRPDTPFAVLIAALLSDETEATLGPLRPATERISVESAAMATTRHARMVTHEIRNALVPVQGALERLYRDAERRQQEDLITKHRESIDQGIDRIFRFIKEMMEVAERGVEPPELFAVGAVIHEAIAAVAQEFGRQAAFTSTPELPSVKGYRHRFMLVMVNLLRNAVQASDKPSPNICIQAEWTASTGEVTITVDDDGPGVRREHRTNIFKQGVSLRAGGTGQGLALVRDVIESEMGGQVTCEDGSLGGARFVLKVPVTERQSS